MLMFKRKKAPKRAEETPAAGAGTPETGALPLEEQKFLEGFEKMVKQSKKAVDPTEELRRERRQEYDAIADGFQPSTSLYDVRRVRKGGLAPARQDDSRAASGNGDDPRSDPRNQDFYRRLNRNRGAAPAAPSAPAAAPAPSGGVVGDLRPGSIVQFDDNSIAVFKDAVSGKDYALFYFLEPDMTLAPRGIFIEQYEMTPIGLLSAPVLQDMAATRRWDRDVVVFHLSSFEYAQAIRQLLMGNAGSGPAEAVSPSARQAAPPVAAPRAQAPVPAREETSASAEPPAAAEFVPASEGGAKMLERGRQLRINVGGRVWESIYWTSDEIGPIVAHHTNREWALMHLDLGRFGDAIEYGPVMTERELKAIAKSLAKQSQ